MSLRLRRADHFTIPSAHSKGIPKNKPNTNTTTITSNGPIDSASRSWAS